MTDGMRCSLHRNEFGADGTLALELLPILLKCCGLTALKVHAGMLLWQTMLTAEVGLAMRAVSNDTHSSGIAGGLSVLELAALLLGHDSLV